MSAGKARSINPTATAITSAGASPGNTARPMSVSVTPITGADNRAVTISSSGIATSHAQARPISPNCAPIRKLTGKRIAPHSDAFIAIPGRPSALVTGAKRICTVITSSASARICT